MAESGGLQLLPESRRRVGIKGKKKRGSIVLGIFLVVIIAGAYIAADFYLTSLNDELAGLDGQVLAIEQRRDKEAERDIRILNSQLSLIGSLLGRHIFWTKGFDKIERLTVPQLEYLSLNADAEKGEITARVQAPSYSELAKQISAYFADETINGVDASGIVLLANGGIGANLLIKFDKSNFLYNL